MLNHDTSLVLLALVGLAHALLAYMKMSRHKKRFSKKN